MVELDFCEWVRIIFVPRLFLLESKKLHMYKWFPTSPTWKVSLIHVLLLISPLTKERAGKSIACL